MCIWISFKRLITILLGLRTLHILQKPLNTPNKCFRKRRIPSNCDSRFLLWAHFFMLLLYNHWNEAKDIVHTEPTVMVAPTTKSQYNQTYAVTYVRFYFLFTCTNAQSSTNDLKPYSDNEATDTRKNMLVIHSILFYSTRRRMKRVFDIYLTIISFACSPIGQLCVVFATDMFSPSIDKFRCSHCSF